MRPDEVIRLRWDDILWDKSLIFVIERKTQKSTRHVPQSDRVRTVLKVRFDQSNGSIKRAKSE
jgi:integrase